ncbi:MAG: hypothetical protein JWR01_1813 [Subtercola sp.]|nr:hypothetical protein [Subtercola sp.]
MTAAAVILFVLAIVLVGTTVLAAGGVLPLNRYAGIRVHFFVLSQEAWQTGHAAALRPITLGGLLAVAGGVVALVRPGSVGVVVVAFLLLFALVAWGIVRGDRAALDAHAASVD